MFQPFIDLVFKHLINSMIVAIHTERQNAMNLRAINIATEISGTYETIRLPRQQQPAFE